MTPQVSVILPTHNRAGLLPRAIASVLQQTFRELELIVVDDGSTDGTDAVVRSFADPRLVYVRNERASGDANARNIGVARARTQWLAFQDSDDEWVPHGLAQQVARAARARPDHAAVASALLRLTPARVELIAWPLPDGHAAEGEVDLPRFVAGGCAYLQSMLVRRSAFEALGGFDTAFRARSDVDFCLRLIRRYGILATTEVLALSHETDGSLSLNPEFRRADMQRLFEKYADLIAADPAVHSHFLYDLAKAELACNHRADSVRTTARSLRLDPWVARTWALLAVAPFGARGLAAAAAWRRRPGRRP